MAPPSRKLTPFTSAPASTARFAPVKSPSFAASHKESCASAGDFPTIAAGGPVDICAAPINEVAEEIAALVAYALAPLHSPSNCFRPPVRPCAGDPGGVGERRPADAAAARRTVGLMLLFRALAPVPPRGTIRVVVTSRRYCSRCRSAAESRGAGAAVSGPLPYRRLDIALPVLYCENSLIEGREPSRLLTFIIEPSELWPFDEPRDLGAPR